jgi:hypothetical protein
MRWSGLRYVWDAGRSADRVLRGGLRSGGRLEGGSTGCVLRLRNSISCVTKCLPRVYQLRQLDCRRAWVPTYEGPSQLCCAVCCVHGAQTEVLNDGYSFGNVCISWDFIVFKTRCIGKRIFSRKMSHSVFLLSPVASYYCYYYYYHCYYYYYYYHHQL